MVKHDMLQLVLDRTDIVEGGMPPFRIVKVIDIVHDQGTGQLGRQIRVSKGRSLLRQDKRLINSGTVGVYVENL